MRPFHLALPVTNLAEAESFYCELLGCSKGRTASRWIDLNFFGHQVTLHLVDDDDIDAPASNTVDDDAVPARHFGVVLNMADWQALAHRLEQATLFLCDPSGNALEFKGFKDAALLFAT